jgi:hypothetical protein
VPVHTLSRIESGAADVDVLTLSAICEKVMNLPLHELFNEIALYDNERLLAVGVPAALRQALTKPCREIIVADDASAAIEAAGSQPIDCVLLGADFAQHIEAIRSAASGQRRPALLLVLGDSEQHGAQAPNYIRVLHGQRKSPPQQVDAYLLRTRQGRICNVRRLRLRLEDRREVLFRLHERVAESRQLLEDLARRAQQPLATLPAAGDPITQASTEPENKTARCSSNHISHRLRFIDQRLAGFERDLAGDVAAELSKLCM